MGSNTTTIFRLAVVVALILALFAALVLFRNDDERISGSEIKAMQEYFLEFDRITAEGDANVQALQALYPEAFEDVEQTKLWYAGYVEAYQAVLDALETLEAPDPIADEVAEFISTGHQLQTLSLERLDQLNAVPDKAAMDAIFADESPFTSTYERQFGACVRLRGIAATNGIFVQALATCEQKVTPAPVTTTPAPSTASG